MRRIKRAMAFVLTLIMATGFVVGCSGTGGESSPSESFEESSFNESVSSSDEHTHVFSEAWETSSSYHWRECACGSKTDIEKHVGEATSCVEKPKCEVCGKEFGKPADHTYTEVTDIGGGVLGLDCVGCDKTIPLLSEEKDGEFVEGVIDFVVEVDEGKDPIVLQLSDTQLCDWGSLENDCFRYIRETVEATDPDLIILTGDIVYGRFDETGSLLLDFIAFMDSLEIPWAPVFGNHDNECILGVDWQCQQLENAEYCLFEQRDLTGNGNYSVGIMQGGEILRVFYMLDSNGCSSPMIDRNEKSTPNDVGKNVVKTSAGFGSTQEEWYNSSITILKSILPNVKISFAFHIQIAAFAESFKQYEEYDGELQYGSSSALKNPVNLNTLETAKEGDFGYIGRVVKGAWDADNKVFENLKELGVDSIFVGHEHCNSASIVYEGIRLQFGQKSSTYDRYNWVKKDGVTIQGDYADKMPSGAQPLMGGTAIPLSQEDGSIVGAYIYLYGDPLGLNP